MAYLRNSGSTSAHSKQRSPPSSLLNRPRFFPLSFFVNLHLLCQPTASLSSARPYMENPPAGRWILRLGSVAGCDGASNRSGASIGGVRLKRRRRRRRRAGERQEEREGRRGPLLKMKEQKQAGAGCGGGRAAHSVVKIRPRDGERENGGAAVADRDAGRRPVTSASASSEAMSPRDAASRCFWEGGSGKT